jgi:beta-glucosidase
MIHLSYPFQNSALPLTERVDDLISRFTLEEKLGLMLQYQPAVERLGVKPYKHGTEAAHGIAWLGKATSFPQPIGLGCTWNPELMRKIGSAIGDEARVFYQRNPAVHGLTLWAPTIDMERDPRWGRTEEAYGEDPCLTGELVAGLVQGIQGDHPFYFKAIATLKHFLGNNNEIHRGYCSASIDPRNMKEYYQQPFRIAFLKGGARSMMTAYNSINGTPAVLHEDVNRVVKGEWGMDGFIVSDAGDVVGLVRDHHYCNTYKEAVALSVRAGIDSITDDKDICLAALREALYEELLTEEDLDQALRNTFRVRFRLGEFDAEAINPYANVPEAILCCEEHSALSLEAARESIVLLKNTDGLLPLNKHNVSRIAVIGPLGNVVYRDWYSGTYPYAITPLEGIRSKLAMGEVVFCEGSDRITLRSAASGLPIGLNYENSELTVVSTDEEAEVFVHYDWGWNSHTLRSAAMGKLVTVTDDGRLAAASEEAFGWYVKELLRWLPQDGGEYRLTAWDGKAVQAADAGKGLLHSVDSSFPIKNELFAIDKLTDGVSEAVEAARQSDIAVVFVGNNPLINGKEEIDRPDIALPEPQRRLIREVAKANRKTVVVIVGSYPFSLEGVEEHVSSIVYMAHAGQELGNACADVLFGDYNPAGRLNMTWYRSVDQLPDIMDYDIIRGQRTYMYFEDEPQYPFGYGLSYTEFDYSDLQLSTLSSKRTQVRVRVTNIGKAAGDEVVQMYIRAGASRVKRARKQLKGFSRIHLQSGESSVVEFQLPHSELAIWDVTREQYCVEAGEYTVMIGRSSADIVLEAVLSIEGESIPPRDLTEWTKAHHYDDCEGIILDECKEGGICVRSRGKGSWLRFSEVKWAGIERLELQARVRGGYSAGGRLEVRIGGPEGPVAGWCEVPPTDGITPQARGHQGWCTVSAPIQGWSDTEDIVVMLSGTVDISRLRIISMK